MVLLGDQLCRLILSSVDEILKGIFPLIYKQIIGFEVVSHYEIYFLFEI